MQQREVSIVYLEVAMDVPSSCFTIVDTFHRRAGHFSNVTTAENTWFTRGHRVQINHGIVVFIQSDRRHSIEH